MASIGSGDFVRHSRSFLLFTAVLVCVMAGTPASALPSEGLARQHPPVIETGAQEFSPAADGAYVAWAGNTTARPNRFNVYFSQNGGAPQRVNPPGTRGWTGGIDGTDLVYTESDADRSGDLVLYDMATDTTIPLPAGVNTGRVEHNATNSGDYLLFDRDRFTRRRAVESIVLFNTATDTQIVLAERSGSRTFLASGQVNGNWAVYFICRGRVCNTFRYDITGQTTEKVPNPSDFQQYAPSVSDAGAVFFLRSPPACGHNVRFMTWDGTTSPELFLALPEGRDSFDTFVDDSAGGSLYYERIRCRNFASDIYSEPIV
jgi:hypothetical protein